MTRTAVGICFLAYRPESKFGGCDCIRMEKVLLHSVGATDVRFKEAKVVVIILIIAEDDLGDIVVVHLHLPEYEKELVVSVEHFLHGRDTPRCGSQACLVSPVLSVSRCQLTFGCCSTFDNMSLN